MYGTPWTGPGFDCRPTEERFTRNFRIICQLCNERIARVNGCVGALYCVRAVSNASGVRIEDVMRLWYSGHAAAKKKQRTKRFTEYKIHNRSTLAEIWYKFS